ncbi:MAG: hypothetical protein OXH94_06670 [Rhodospirillales bacterium]|nr:hypothetical protein [Rhodospirillales bacterium]
MGELVRGRGYRPWRDSVRSTIKRMVLETSTSLRLFFGRRRRARCRDARDRSIRGMSMKALGDIGLGRVYDRTFRVPE